MIDQRSGCPINLAMEALGDRWSLVIVRDMMFGNRRHFRELLNQSLEGIASNILAARLKRLTDLGLITRRDDPSHKQKGIYSLTEIAIQLVPVLALLGAWGRRNLPATRALSARAQVLEEGGPDFWAQLMDELRVQHLGAAPTAASARRRQDSAMARLDDAVLTAQDGKAKKARSSPRSR